MHRTHNFSAAFVNTPAQGSSSPRCRPVFATSWPAGGTNRRNPSFTRPSAEIVFMKSFEKFVWFAAGAALFVSSGANAQSRAQYESMVATHAQANNVPEALVHRVIVRESKYHAGLVGRGGTIGLMQIKLPTARGL